MNRIRFSTEGDEFCCGVLRIGSFEEVASSIFTGAPARPFREEEFIEEIEERANDHMRDSYSNRGGVLVQCTLPIKASSWTGISPVYQTVYDTLKKNKWKVYKKWVNTNTGNTLVGLCKYFSKRTLARKYG